MNTKRITIVLVVYIVCLLSNNVNAQKSSANDYIPPTQTEKTLGVITLIQNIRYAPIPELTNNSTSDRILDLFLPDQTKTNKLLPVFVFIHGGGFHVGDKGLGLTEFYSKIASNGFAVASINYRLALKHKKVEGASSSTNRSKGLPSENAFYPALNEALVKASEDAILALKWLKANAVKYKLDVNNVAIAGGSAGAMTALYVAYASHQKVLPIKAVVDLWGGLENVKVINKNAAPLLIYHGDSDKVVSVKYAYTLQKRMKKIGSKRSVSHILKDKGHAQYKYITENKVPEIVDFLKTNLK